jgi:hypothetical protein
MKFKVTDAARPQAEWEINDDDCYNIADVVNKYFKNGVPEGTTIEPIPAN